MDSNKRNSNGHAADDEGNGNKRTRIESSPQENPVDPAEQSNDSVHSRGESEICSDEETERNFSDLDVTAGPSVPSGSRDNDTGLPASEESDEDEEDGFFESLKKNTTAPKPGELFGPKYDTAEESFVLYEADLTAQRFSTYVNPDGFVPVVVDPDVAELLRPDQKDGIQFMFNNYNKGQGCLLAHEMGVGKTLSCITLVHTLLHQSVNSSRHYRPSLSKVVIVTPKTLVTMWEEEFENWLKSERPKIVTTACKPKEDESTIKDFLSSKSKAKVLIISYETIKKHARFFHVNAGSENDEDDDWNLEAPLDLVIFDEVHRLKNHKSQVSKACHGLEFKVKIGLTGTPVQNTLEELCRLVDIVQPNALLTGTGCNEAEFDEQYTKRFSAGNLTKRSYVLSPADTVKLTKLKDIIGPILHIRQNKVNVPKYEMIVCGRLEELQMKLYKGVTDILENEKNKNNFWYASVTLLRNICHHPVLARRTLRTTEHKSMKSLLLPTVEEICKPYKKKIDNLKSEPVLSQKIKFICGLVFTNQEKYETDRVLNKAKIQDKERVVVVSNSTQVLEKVEKALKEGFGIKCLSITGKTSTKDRTKNYKRFNNLYEDNPVFLLSSKAGGVGITLTGGNHLVMLDPDWNPASDEQAMARIWREGQTKPCYIYRLFATGTVEEVMFKRQLSKKELDRYITEEDFTKFDILREGVRELFSYDPDTLSSIHDSINCTKEECPRPSLQMALPYSPQAGPSSSMTVPFPGFSAYALEVDDETEGDDRAEIESDISSLAKWSHFVREDQLPQGDDELPILRKLWNYNGTRNVGISFVFYKKTETKNIIPIQDPTALIDFLVSPGSVSARQVEI